MHALSTQLDLFANQIPNGLNQPDESGVVHIAATAAAVKQSSVVAKRPAKRVSRPRDHMEMHRRSIAFEDVQLAPLPSNPLAGAKALHSRSVETLADLVAYFQGEGRDHPKRFAIRSAINLVGKLLQQPLQDVPASPRWLARHLASSSPAAIGVKRANVANARSLVAEGLREAGVEVIPLRDLTPLLGPWGELHSRVQETRQRIGLGKFMKFCSRHDVDPEDVTETTFEAFRDELELKSLHGNTQGSYAQSIRLWNRASDSVPGWPCRVTARKRDTRVYALGWETFPQSFVEDAEAFLKSRQQTNVFAADYTKPVRAATTKTRRDAIRRMASILKLSGIEAESLTSLADLYSNDRPVVILKSLVSRRVDEELRPNDFGYTDLLRTIARFWVKDGAAADRLKAMIEPIRRDAPAPPPGMTGKNRSTLQQFDNIENICALRDLPDKTLGRIRRKNELTHRDHVQVMYSVVIAIQMHVALRAKNLTELEIGSNLVQVGRGRHRFYKVVLRANQTKTKRDFSAPLPRHLTPLLDLWLKKHRTGICKTQSRYLFPNSRGELRAITSFSTQVMKFIRKETGVRMNMHFFRHLLVKNIVEAGPGGLESGSLMLGHASIQTTRDAYANLKADPAFAALDQALSGLGQRRPVVRRPVRR